MSVTVTSVDGKLDDYGDGFMAHSFTVLMDSSYPTGGESCDFTSSSVADPYFTTVRHVIVSPNAGYVGEYDHANSKLKAYYADYDAGADGALIEVGNGTNLSSVTFYVTVFGVK